MKQFLICFTTFPVIREHCMWSSYSLSEKSSWSLCSACLLRQVEWGTAEAIGDLCASAGHSLAWIIETWWKNSHGWCATMDGHGPFTKDGLALRVGTLVNAKEQQEHTELCLGQVDNCLWVYGSEIEGKPVWAALWWMSATNPQWEVNKASSASWKKTHAWRPWSSWGLETPGWSTVGTTEQNTSSHRGIWS